MGSFVVTGGNKLKGEITPQGAKNEALQVVSADFANFRRSSDS